MGRAVGICFVMFVFVAVATGCNNQSSQLATLEDRVSRSERLTSNLGLTLDGMSANVRSSLSKLDAISSRLDELDARIAALEAVAHERTTVDVVPAETAEPSAEPAIVMAGEPAVEPFSEAAPVATFAFSPTDPQVGQPILLASGSLSPDSEIVSWNWEFPDGTTVEGQTTSYTATEPGALAVTHRVVDDLGRAAEVTRSVYVGVHQDCWLRVFVDSVEEIRDDGIGNEWEFSVLVGRGATWTRQVLTRPNTFHVESVGEWMAPIRLAESEGLSITVGASQTGTSEKFPDIGVTTSTVDAVCPAERNLDLDVTVFENQGTHNTLQKAIWRFHLVVELTSEAP